jgi:GT2 family glycosyltransferase
MQQQPYISILIPTQNNEEDLIDCLNSIRTLDYPYDKIEVIIWDNDSRQESINRIANFLLQIREEKNIRVEFMQHNDNYGVYTSRDELFKLVGPDAEFILSIDDDVILPPELLKEALPIFAKDNQVGIVGPRTVYDDAPSETAHGAGFINWWLGRYRILDARKPVMCDYVIGCCMLIKKSVIDEIGGFDRDYYTSHGEIDFCLRAKNKGYKILYRPEVRVRHRVERGGTRIPQRMYYVYRNKLFVIRKNAPLPQKWMSLGIYSLFWLPKSILESVIRNRRIDSTEIQTILKAMADGWRKRGGKRDISYMRRS